MVWELEIATLAAGSVDDVAVSLDVPVEVVAVLADSLVEAVTSVGLFVEEVLVSASVVPDLAFIHANGLKPPEEVVDEAVVAASVDTSSSASLVVEASLS